MSRDPGSRVGGQAVIEGVMMRSPTSWAVAVRRPDGVIEAVSHELPALTARSRLARVPFIRGVLVLVESLTLGFRALSWSARKAGDEDAQLSRTQIAGTMVIAVGFVILAFMLLPLLAARTFDDFLGDSSLVFNVIDGIVRLGLFVGYVWLIGKSKEVQRVFEYHGAEHKTIHAYEAGDPLISTEIQKYSPRHPRCGTNFLLIVILIALVVFTLVGRPSLPWLVASRVLLIPVIAGFSYELLKAAADRPWMAGAAKPGMWLQALTTREPAGDQVEVAVTGLLAALDGASVDEVKQRGPVEPAALEAEFN